MPELYPSARTCRRIQYGLIYQLSRGNKSGQHQLSDHLAGIVGLLPGFGTSTFSISLYNSAIQVPQWQKTPTESGSYLPNYDMTQACAWSVPICDYSTWKSLSKQAGWPGYNPSPTINDGILNTAWYFAYNLNFTPEAYFCADYQGSNGPYGAPPPLHSCQNWFPKRVVNLS